MRRWIGSVLLSLSSVCMASNSFFCADTSNYVQLGDSLNQVFSKCGTPVSTQTQKTPSSQSMQVTQWVYNYQNHPASITKMPTYQTAALIVNLINNKISSLLVNGQDVQSTNFCGPNPAINVGDSNITVRQLCGIPSQIQQVAQNVPQQSTQRMILTYQNTATQQSSELIIENGQLIQINP